MGVSKKLKKWTGISSGVWDAALFPISATEKAMKAGTDLLTPDMPDMPDASADTPENQGVYGANIQLGKSKKRTSLARPNAGTSGGTTTTSSKVGVRI